MKIGTRDAATAKAGAQTTRQVSKTIREQQKQETSHGATARALRRARSAQRVRRGQDTFARCHSESVSTHTISAEGSPRSRQFKTHSHRRHIRTLPQRKLFDTHDLRRGFAEVKTHSPGAAARALRHTGFSQRVRRDQDMFARRHSKSVSTRTICAEGSPRPRHIRTAPQREHFDTHYLRRGFAETKTQSHGTTAGALRHARSPQRVRRGQDNSRHIRTAPQRERFDTHDLRREFAETKTHSHGATARSSFSARTMRPQRVRRDQNTLALRRSESACVSQAPVGRG